MLHPFTTDLWFTSCRPLSCFDCCEIKLACLQRRLPPMDLESALKDCTGALELFLNNRFASALALLEPRWVKGWEILIISLTLCDFKHFEFPKFTIWNFYPLANMTACIMQWATVAFWWCRPAWPSTRRTWMRPWHHWENLCRRARGMFVCPSHGFAAFKVDTI